MDTIVLKIDPKIKDKFLWLLSHFKKNEIEVELNIESVSKEDSDFKYFEEIKDEETVDFEEYLKNEYKN